MFTHFGKQKLELLRGLPNTDIEKPSGTEKFKL